MCFLCPGCELVVYFVLVACPELWDYLACLFVLILLLCGGFGSVYQVFYVVGCCPFLYVLGEVLSVFRFF